jgi:hypothetical protein
MNRTTHDRREQMANIPQTSQPIDRTGWASGPWDDEPDRVEWRHVSGLPCLANRNRTGSWCGYVAVPSGHPAYGQPYRNIDVDVHGDLTYSHSCHGDICHVPQSGESDDVWWLGFDCAHLGDYTPGVAAALRLVGYNDPDPSDYCTLAYVQAETNRLADQLVAMK